MRGPAIAMLCGVVACAHPARTGVRGGEVLRHADELGHTGYAELDTVTITDDAVVPADREHVFVDQSVTFDGRATTLTRLLEGCPPFRGAAPCLLGAHTADFVVLRAGPRPGPYAPKPDPVATEQAPRDARQELSTVLGVVTLGSLAGAGLCGLICDAHKGAVAGALLGTGIVTGLLWLLASGGHD